MQPATPRGWISHRKVGWDGGRRVNVLPGCPTAAFKSSVGSNPAMVKALRNWLEAHELLAIVAGVLGVIVVLSVILAVGGYLIVTT